MPVCQLSQLKNAQYENTNALVSVKYLEDIAELKVLFQKEAKLFHDFNINLPFLILVVFFFCFYDIPPLL